MERKIWVRVHLIATVLAVFIVSTFFIASLVAELNGDPVFIRGVKRGILYSLPLLIFVMPALAITGNKLARRSKSPQVLRKQQRMRWVGINGFMLVSLAIFLYYRSHYHDIDRAFLFAQLAEFVLGLTNLVLIALNARSGLQLSGRLKKLDRTS